MSTVHRTALESDIRSAIMNKVIPDCCCVFCKVFAFLFAVKGMENGKELPRDARHEKQHICRLYSATRFRCRLVGRPYVLTSRLIAVLPGFAQALEGETVCANVFLKYFLFFLTSHTPFFSSPTASQLSKHVTESERVPDGNPSRVAFLWHFREGECLYF